MDLVFILVCIAPFLVGLGAGDKTIYSKHCGNGVCEREEDKGPCMDDRRPKLFRWEPIRVSPFYPLLYPPFYVFLCKHLEVPLTL